MKQLACREAGNDCDTVITGRDDNEVMQKAEQHAKTKHNMQSMKPEDKQRLRGLIKSA